jgi:peptide/nickel transport system substrate-binding protein
MGQQHERSVTRRIITSIGVLSWLFVLVSTARCHQGSGPVASQTATTLRAGVGGLSLQAPQAGVRQLVNNLSLEGLINFNEDGRPRPFLAESWTTASDGLTLTLQLHRNAKYHDGTPVTAQSVVSILKEALPKAMGSAFDDIAEISAVDDAGIRFQLRQPAPLVIEALETLIQKPGKDAISVGPYVLAGPSSPLELKANPSYYQGRPAIDRILLTSYPTVRAAWAELLRGGLDMLYEVNVDALDSLESSSNIAVFSFVRHYQYAIIFGSRVESFKSAAIRRELNAAIDREVFVGQGLNGHGVPSSGPVPPRHWALADGAPKLAFNPELAARLPGRHFRFTCLVPADSVYERVALAVKRQLSAASVDMQVQEVTQDQLVKAAAQNDFEALLVDTISGPSLFRSYQRWHSGGPFPLKTIESPVIDAALDRIRHAKSDDEYRAGVTAFQQAVVDDPPAIFLAWAQRARAVSRRFEVPRPEDGRDALATLRLWKPAAEIRLASRN